MRPCSNFFTHTETISFTNHPPLIVFPNCKINLGLSVLKKRNDGFHDLETVFYPLKVNDVLEVISSSVIERNATNSKRSLIQFTNTGLSIQCDEENNLCIRAYHLLKKDFPDLPPVKMHLHKAIPMGAGLGGGSADAAFTLLLLNEKYHLNLSKPKLIDYAVELGSDCAFFIINKPCFATSRGEMIEEIPLTLSGYTLLLVNPGIHINTGWAFSTINRSKKTIEPSGRTSIKQIIKQPVNSWKDVLANDFEKPVFEKYPEIKTIKEQLYHDGALYAGMSGSGSTVFGIFDAAVYHSIRFSSAYTVIKLKLE